MSTSPLLLLHAVRAVLPLAGLPNPEEPYFLNIGVIPGDFIGRKSVHFHRDEGIREGGVLRDGNRLREGARPTL